MNLEVSITDLPLPFTLLPQLVVVFLAASLTSNESCFTRPLCHAVKLFQGKSSLALSSLDWMKFIRAGPERFVQVSKKM
jgi:hypothetical protein